jgi:hypothetical protein
VNGAEAATSEVDAADQPAIVLADHDVLLLPALRRRTEEEEEEERCGVSFAKGVATTATETFITMLNHGLTSMALLLATIVLPSTAAARDACMVVTGATGWVASHVVNDALSVRRNPPAGCLPPPSHDAWPLTHFARSSALSLTPPKGSAL